MDVNADFSRRAAVHSAQLPWAPSPMRGVDRRMLDRVGDEVARATSIVRYAPASSFSPHVHGGGEEFLVLSGVFSDEHAEYPAGFYVRNPPTSKHTPSSKLGCTIFVKLWQFNPEDRTEIRVGTDAMPFAAAQSRPGVDTMLLFADEHEEVRIEQWLPGTQVSLPEQGGHELLVLDGSLVEDGETFEPHSWLRLPADAGLDGTDGPLGGRV
ncbi:MAG: cupin domain-containing protein, partial [Sphingomonas bacterium]|nr:cupin domain-containing protein [Sphingomonas bacterium]